ncbi:MAG: hypothetical protein KDA78_09290, partial [Planctomycetaceae bacterium]|nr:hypothetical protein [Planctomycetaceae bacterium]
TGYQVLDDRGDRVVVPPGASIHFASDGSITAHDPISGLPISLGRFDLVQPENLRLLAKQGDSLYSAPEETLVPAGPEVQVRQGFQEQSTVQPVHEMLNMIQTSRAFEANMNLIQHQEHTLGQLLQAIGQR